MYEPKVGDVVTAEFTVTRSRRGGSETRTTWRQVFGQVQHVTPKRVLVQTLKTSAFGFQKNDTWVPRGSVLPASAPQRERWHEAMGDCDALVRALRDNYVQAKE